MYDLILKNFAISYISMGLAALVNLIVSGDHFGTLNFWVYVFGWTVVWTVYDLFKKRNVKDINDA
jgi:membrane-associated PAP2 superfamily phosphatase